LSGKMVAEMLGVPMSAGGSASVSPNRSANFSLLPRMRPGYMEASAKYPALLPSAAGRRSR
jgi:hypothetical protein